MGVLSVALLQLLAAGNDQDANLRKGEWACREAARMGADLAVFPEMWNIGYYEWGEAGDDAAALRRQAISADSGFAEHFRCLASELDMAIAITFLERWPTAPRNTVVLFDRHGRVVLSYAKVHTCDFGDEASLTPGREFPVAELDTKAGPVMVGTMICFDLLFPEAARALMLEGAELILVPNASRNDENHRVCLRARSVENMVAIAQTNYAAPQQGGLSVAFDAVSYAWDGDGATIDPTILQADAGEGIHIAQFDMARIRGFREAETQGDAYRKPESYNSLVRTDVRPPFRRPDSRRGKRIDDVSIRPADPVELDRLCEIAADGKRFWGYDPDLVEEWVALGDFTPEVFAAKDVFVATAADEIIAWSSLILNGDVCWLDDLWVDPPWIRHGVGRRLFDHAVSYAKAAGATAMEWEAEPFAFGFYEKMGGRHLRDSERSPIWNRKLPVMGVAILGERPRSVI
jgi:predicted amidohydrolase/GNAT superfamily N-acetyltransferase